jgi:hypothetical protein
VFGAGLSIAITITPIIGALLQSYGDLAATQVMVGSVSGMTVLVALPLLYRFRDRLLATKLNRLLAGALVTVSGLLTLISFGDWLFGMPAAQTFAHLQLICAAVAAMGALATHAGFFVPALCYATAYVYLSWRPEDVYWVLAVENGVLASTVVAVWGRPVSGQGTR